MPNPDWPINAPYSDQIEVPARKTRKQRRKVVDIFGTPTVVARDFLSWNATRRERSGHQRHDDAVIQLK